MNKVIGIIPARAGSKRLKGKNMYPLKGKPLIEYTIDAALNSRYLSKSNLYVTTDCERIKDLCKSKRVKVIGIEITNGGKYGDPVDEVPWSKVTGRNVTVDLDNDKWAYAEQIRRI